MSSLLHVHLALGMSQQQRNLSCCGGFPLRIMCACSYSFMGMGASAAVLRTSTAASANSVSFARLHHLPSPTVVNNNRCRSSFACEQQANRTRTRMRAFISNWNASTAALSIPASASTTASMMPRAQCCSSGEATVGALSASSSSAASPSPPDKAQQIVTVKGELHVSVRLYCTHKIEQNVTSVTPTV